MISTDGNAVLTGGTEEPACGSRVEGFFDPVAELIDRLFRIVFIFAEQETFDDFRLLHAAFFVDEHFEDDLGPDFLLFSFFGVFRKDDAYRLGVGIDARCRGCAFGQAGREVFVDARFFDGEEGVGKIRGDSDVEDARWVDLE